MWNPLSGSPGSLIRYNLLSCLPPLADLTRHSTLPSRRRLLLPSFRPSRLPFSPSDISTVASGHLHRQDSHLLERQLASLHERRGFEPSVPEQNFWPPKEPRIGRLSARQSNRFPEVGAPGVRPVRQRFLRLPRSMAYGATRRSHFGTAVVVRPCTTRFAWLKTLLRIDERRSPRVRSRGSGYRQAGLRPTSLTKERTLVTHSSAFATATW
jgi:hypothetical protein